jgi:hypothetical protein
VGVSGGMAAIVVDGAGAVSCTADSDATAGDFGNAVFKFDRLQPTAMRQNASTSNGATDQRAGRVTDSPSTRGDL